MPNQAWEASSVFHQRPFTGALFLNLQVCGCCLFNSVFDAKTWPSIIEPLALSQTITPYHVLGPVRGFHHCEFAGWLALSVIQ